MIRTRFWVREIYHEEIVCQEKNPFPNLLAENFISPDRSEKSRLLGIENSGTTGTFISRVCGSENTAENYPVHSGFNSLSDPPEGFPLPTSRRQYGKLKSGTPVQSMLGTLFQG